MSYSNFLDIKDIINSESIIFDIGSNVGNFSKYICENNLYKKIYLFEPHQQYFNKSKETLNIFKNLEFINKGVGNKNETLTLYCDSTNIGWNTFLKKDPNQPDDFFLRMDSRKVDIITLDSFCLINNITKIDLIKIDVEGFEYKVIEGFLNTLLNIKPYFYIEVGWGTNHPEWDKCKIIYEKLFDLGYEKIFFSNKTEDILFKPPINSSIH